MGEVIAFGQVGDGVVDWKCIEYDAERLWALIGTGQQQHEDQLRAFFGRSGYCSQR